MKWLHLILLPASVLVFNGEQNHAPAMAALPILVKLIQLFGKYVTNYSFKRSEFKCWRLFNYPSSFWASTFRLYSAFVSNSGAWNLSSGFRSLPCILSGNSGQEPASAPSSLPEELPLQIEHAGGEGTFALVSGKQLWWLREQTLLSGYPVKVDGVLVQIRVQITQSVYPTESTVVQR